MLLGTGVVAILGAYGGVIKLSSLHGSQSRTTNALTIAAEAVASPATTYSACAGADTNSGIYRTAIDGALADASNTIAVDFTVSYWNGTQFVTGEANCRDNDNQVPAMQRMQQITLTAVVPTQSNPWSLTIIKRAA